MSDVAGGVQMVGVSVVGRLEWKLHRGLASLLLFTGKQASVSSRACPIFPDEERAEGECLARDKQWQAEASGTCPKIDAEQSSAIGAGTEVNSELRSTRPLPSADTAQARRDAVVMEFE